MTTLLSLPISIDDLDRIIETMDDGGSHDKQHSQILRHLLEVSREFKKENS